MTQQSDARRRIPRTDAVLADPRLAPHLARSGYAVVRSAVVAAQRRAREEVIAPDDVVADALAALPRRVSSLTPALNATGVVVHTNLGRAPLSRNAIEAVCDAAGYVDVEFDLASGVRSRRGVGAVAALCREVPDAGGAHVVNNGAAALVLATTALAAGREAVVSRGEMVEIGDGFRLPDLIASTGARLREVGTTNRTTRADYAAAIGPDTGCVLKVHPSNFRIDGFTSAVPVRELRDLGVPVVADLGSGLLRPDPVLPDEPDATTALRAGADLVTCSGDKLLGGPQAGLLLGTVELVERLRRHPLARALRVDKLTLAALEATLSGVDVPVMRSLHADPESLRERVVRLARACDRPERDVIPSEARVGGGGAPCVPLDSWALAVPAAVASVLRTGDPVVVARVERGRCLLDLRCVPPEDDDRVAEALRRALETAGVAASPEAVGSRSTESKSVARQGNSASSSGA